MMLATRAAVCRKPRPFDRVKESHTYHLAQMVDHVAECRFCNAIAKKSFVVTRFDVVTVNIKGRQMSAHHERAIRDQLPDWSLERGRRRHGQPAGSLNRDYILVDSHGPVGATGCPVIGTKLQVEPKTNDGRSNEEEEQEVARQG
jgi:hypothetical protein